MVRTEVMVIVFIMTYCCCVSDITMNARTLAVHVFDPLLSASMYGCESEALLTLCISVQSSVTSGSGIVMSTTCICVS